MGFWDAVGSVVGGAVEALAELVSSPEAAYALGKSHGLEGSARRLTSLRRDDGTDEWDKDKARFDAYTRGYDDGMQERLRS